MAAGEVIKTQHGPAIAILHQYAYTGQGKTIHSSGQLEWYKNNDKFIKVAGWLQCITNDGYVIPIIIRDGLSYVALCLLTDEEWDSLPHVILTGEADLDPGVLDLGLDDNETWLYAISDLPLDKRQAPFCL